MDELITTTADTLFTRLIESPEFDALSPGQRTRLMQLVAIRANDYALDANRF